MSKTFKTYFKQFMVTTLYHCTLKETLFLFNSMAQQYYLPFILSVVLTLNLFSYINNLIYTFAHQGFQKIITYLYYHITFILIILSFLSYSENEDIEMEYKLLLVAISFAIVGICQGRPDVGRKSEIYSQFGTKHIRGIISFFCSTDNCY